MKWSLLLDWQGPLCKGQEALDIRALDFYKRIFRLEGAEYTLGGLLAATVKARTQYMMSFQKQEAAKAKRDGNDERHRREHVLTGAMSVANASASVQFALVRMHALSIEHYMAAIELLPCPGAYDGFVKQYCNAGRLGLPMTRYRTTADLAIQFKEASYILDLCNGHWGIAMLAPFGYGDGPSDSGPAGEATALNGDREVTRLFAQYYKRKKADRPTEATLAGILNHSETTPGITEELAMKDGLSYMVAGGPIRSIAAERRRAPALKQLGEHTLSSEVSQDSSLRISLWAQYESWRKWYEIMEPISSLLECASLRRRSRTNA